MIRGISFFFCSFFLFPVFTQNTVTVHHPGWAGKEAWLEGYDLFDTIVIARFMPDSAGSTTLTTNYRGFALLCNSQGEAYPMIIDGKNTAWAFDTVLKKPVVEPGSPNDELTLWAGRRMKYRMVVNRLLQTAEKTPAEDPFSKELKAEIFRVNSLADIEPGDNTNPLVKLIIDSRRLAAISSRLRTIQAASEWKTQVEKFIRENQRMIRHTDICRQLAQSWLMLDEIVDYGKSGDHHWENTVAQDTRRWISFFNGNDDRRSCSDFMLRFFQGRRMWTFSSDLARSVIDLLDYSDGFYHNDSLGYVPNIRAVNLSGQHKVLGSMADTLPVIIALGDPSSPAANAFLLKTGRDINYGNIRAKLVIGSYTGNSLKWARSFNVFSFAGVIDDEKACQVIWPGENRKGAGITFLLTDRTLKVNGVCYSYQDLVVALKNRE